PGTVLDRRAAPVHSCWSFFPTAAISGITMLDRRAAFVHRGKGLRRPPKATAGTMGSVLAGEETRDNQIIDPRQQAEDGGMKVRAVEADLPSSRLDPARRLHRGCSGIGQMQ